jgi:hypothetical protein
MHANHHNGDSKDGIYGDLDDLDGDSCDDYNDNGHFDYGVDVHGDDEDAMAQTRPRDA